MISHLSVSCNTADLHRSTACDSMRSVGRYAQFNILIIISKPKPEGGLLWYQAQVWLDFVSAGIAGGGAEVLSVCRRVDCSSDVKRT